MLVLVSCQKEEYMYSGRYMSERTEISPIRLFAASGEITNTVLINSYLNRTETGSLNRDISNPPDVAGDVEIMFQGENKALFSYMYYHPLPQTERNVRKTGKYLYLEDPGISTVYNTTSESFFKNIVKHFPLYSKTTLLPASSGFISQTEFKHCMYLEGRQTEILFPMLAYVYRKSFSEGGYHIASIPWSNNEFNTGFVREILPGDTLAVQESSIILVKQKEGPSPH